MKRRLKITLLCLGAFVMVMPFTAQAVKYTTQSGKKKNVPTAQTEAPEGERCTEDNLKKIKRFDKISAQYIKDYFEVFVPMYSPNSKRQYNQYMRDMKKVSYFFKSKKYLEMKGIYDACGREIPRPQIAADFWMPNQEMDDAPLY